MDILNSHLLSSKGIYKIINKVNGKYYIGMTNTSFLKRMKRHLTALRKNIHTNKHLQDSFTKYKETNFVFECFIDMTHFSKEEILAKEESLILENYESGLLYNRSVKALLIRQNEHGDYIKKSTVSSWPVIQLDKNNNFIAKFESCNIAAQHSNNSASVIFNAAKNGVECTGEYNWIYEKNYIDNKDFVIKPMKIKMRKDCRVCLMENDKIIQIFDTIKKASKFFGGDLNTVRNCANGLRPTCSRNRQWKFYEECSSQQKLFFDSIN